jgi:hypothetical protein
VEDLSTFDDIKPGARVKGLDPGGTAEVVQVARFGWNVRDFSRRGSIDHTICS